MGDVGVVARRRGWEIGHDGGDSRPCTRRRVRCWSLASGDGPDEVRKLEKFEWVWVSLTTPLGNGSRRRDGAAVHVGNFGVVHR